MPSPPTSTGHGSRRSTGGRFDDDPVAPFAGLVRTFTYDPATEGLALQTGGPTQTGYAASSGKWMPRYPTVVQAQGGAFLSGGVNGYLDPEYDGTTPFAISDGKLRIRAQLASEVGFTMPDPFGGANATYVSGLLCTRHSFSQQYGVFQCRAKVAAGRSIKSAFWMLPTPDTVNGFDWPPEFDVLEFNGGDLDSYRANVITSDHDFVFDHARGVNLADAYHDYIVKWRRDVVEFWFDTTLIRTIDVSGHPETQSEMYLVLNLAVGASGGWVQAPDGTTPSPADFLIEHVRAWRFAT